MEEWRIRFPFHIHRVLLVGGKLGEGLVVSVRDEERIIAEALDSCRLFGDMPWAVSVDDKLLASRIDKGAAAGEARGAVLYALEVLQEKRVVRGRVAGLAGIARAVHARSTAERLDLETGIVGHAPLAFVLLCNRPHLDKRVACEVGRVFLDSLWIVGNDFKAREYLRDLAYLVLVVRRDKKLHGIILFSFCQILYQMCALAMRPAKDAQGFQMMRPSRLRRVGRIICARVFMPPPANRRYSRQSAPLPPPRRGHAATALGRTCPSCRVKGSCAARTCGASRRTRP